MTLNEYQKQAMTTCLPTSNNFSYMFLNLVGEVCELASKVAKHIRKRKVSIEGNDLITEIPVNERPQDNKKLSEEELQELQKEAGDVHRHGMGLGRHCQAEPRQIGRHETTWRNCQQWG